MEDSRKPSASVIASAVVAILGSLLFLLATSAAFFAFLLMKTPVATPDAPPFLRAMMLGTEGFMMAVAIFGIATGICLLYLRNWARISILTWGGLSVFFGLIGVVVLLLMPFNVNSGGPQLPPNSEPVFRAILSVIYGLPLVIGVWWLILFTRGNVKVQFKGNATTTLQGATPKPACPLPIAIMAWLYVSSILNLAFFPFAPGHVPVFLFGWILPGFSGLVILLLTCVAFFVGGIGLLKLKPWSYNLVLSLQIFWLASSAVSMLRPNYKSAMNAYLQEVQASMHVPPSPFAQPDLFRSFSVWMPLGMLLGLAVLGLFFYYRRRFLENAAKVATTS